MSVAIIMADPVCEQIVEASTDYNMQTACTSEIQLIILLAQEVEWINIK